MSLSPSPARVVPVTGFAGIRRRILQPGRIELTLAAALAMLTIVLDVSTSRPWPPLALDLIACAVAAASARWPRAAGLLLGAVLSVYLFIPVGWATMGEYALLIPILGTGMRGDRRLRLWESVAYLLILTGLNLQNAPSVQSALLGSLLYAVLFGVLWLIGNAFVLVAQAERQAQEAELVLQRQRLALDLHDTVARSLSSLVMATERAKARGHASAEDLSLFADLASRSIDELRQVIEVLHRQGNPGTADGSPQGPRERLEAARAELLRHGFAPVIAITGDEVALDDTSMRVLGAVTGEAVANVIKHGDPNQPCVGRLDLRNGQAILEFVNTNNSAPATHGSPTSLGLWAMRSRISEAGGELIAGPHGDEWITRVILPLQLTSTDASSRSGT